jgi:hypothetical protein
MWVSILSDLPSSSTSRTNPDSGHSTQQSTDDPEEEDGLDEGTLFESFSPRDSSLMRTHLVLVTSDEEVIVDNVGLHSRLSQRRLSADKITGAP